MLIKKENYNKDKMDSHLEVKFLKASSIKNKIWIKNSKNNEFMLYLFLNKYDAYKNHLIKLKSRLNNIKKESLLDIIEDIYESLLTKLDLWTNKSNSKNIKKEYLNKLTEDTLTLKEELIYILIQIIKNDKENGDLEKTIYEKDQDILFDNLNILSNNWNSGYKIITYIYNKIKEKSIKSTTKEEIKTIVNNNSKKEEVDNNTTDDSIKEEKKIKEFIKTYNNNPRKNIFNYKLLNISIDKFEEKFPYHNIAPIKKEATRILKESTFYELNLYLKKSKTIEDYKLYSNNIKKLKELNKYHKETTLRDIFIIEIRFLLEQEIKNKNNGYLEYIYLRLEEAKKIFKDDIGFSIKKIYKKKEKN